jgi:hypothetical protein
MSLAFALMPAELESTLSGNAFKVFSVMRRHADLRGWVRNLVQREIAKLVNLSLGTVNRAIKELTAEAVITQHPPRFLDDPCAYEIAARFLHPEPGTRVPKLEHLCRESLPKRRDSERGSGGASLPPDRPSSLAAPIAAPAGCSRGAGAQADPPEPIPKHSERTPLPDDWLPDDEDLAYALNRSDDHDWLEREIRHFREYHGLQETLSADWRLEWRRWFARGLAYRACRAGRKRRAAA